MAALGQMPNFGLEACLTASGWLLPLNPRELSDHRDQNRATCSA